MTLGQVLKKERERRRLSPAECSTRLGLQPVEYGALESGSPELESWGPRLAQIAVKLETPTSRLIAESGRARDSGKQPGQCGSLIAFHRSRRGLSQLALAEAVALSSAEVERIEAGESPLERVGPLLLRFAEAVDLPVFNLLFPCGLPLDVLDDYP